MSDTLVIIPAYFEQDRIGAVLAELRALGQDWDLLVINDGSPDRTAAAAAAAGATVINHPFNLGYGAALQTGYKYAARHGYQFAIQFDADGQHIAAEAAKLLAPVRSGQADVVFGSRFLAGGGGYHVPLLRKLGIAVFSRVAGWLSGKPLTDVTSGFAAVNRGVIVLFSSNLFPADFPDADVRMMLLKLGLRVMEIPAAMRSGPPEKSMHGGLLSWWYVTKMMISVLIVRISRFTLPADKEDAS